MKPIANTTLDKLILKVIKNEITLKDHSTLLRALKELRHMRTPDERYKRLMASTSPWEIKDVGAKLPPVGIEKYVKVTQKDVEELNKSLAHKEKAKVESNRS
jgi:hypothetical protein